MPALTNNAISYIAFKPTIEYCNVVDNVFQMLPRLFGVKLKVRKLQAQVYACRSGFVVKKVDS